MIKLADQRVHLFFYVEASELRGIKPVIAKSGAYGFSVAPYQSISADGAFWEGDIKVDVHFDDPVKAAAFLASISADRERASLFKMFWGGE